ncbi:MAG: transcription termination/antitermination factor NusG [Lachnospiraceae bacterium]|nr:transcription termination/antitermination factor NusG [Lachnospiraceae bacterium]
MADEKEVFESEESVEAAEVKSEDAAKWYVVHTYSGYENKVKVDLERTIENNKSLAERILEVRVPMEEVVEIRNGVKKTVPRKLFPGYVLVHMKMDNDIWYVVRNIRGITGFVGPGSKPVPLTDAEMKPLGIRTDKVSIDFAEGDTIAVVAGVWKDTVGVVQKLDQSKQTATINVELFGRETPVEISFAEVRKMN